LVVGSTIIIKTTTEKDKKMNDFKYPTISALDYGIVEVTVNGKVEKATADPNLIPAENRRGVSLAQRLSEQLHFYNLNEAIWKTIGYDQITKVKIMTRNSHKVNKTIFKK
jgi:hypothetical protein